MIGVNNMEKHKDLNEKELAVKFLSLTEERDTKVSEHYGDDMLEMLNYPEERYWYSEHIYPLDDKIIKLANIIRDKFLPTKKFYNSLMKVYQDDDLFSYCENVKAKTDREKN